jgi:coenzyme F420-reducing hydrogenase alpha subunit
LEKGGIYSKLVKRQMQKMQNTLDQGKDISKEKTDVIDNLISDE